MSKLNLIHSFCTLSHFDILGMTIKSKFEPKSKYNNDKIIFYYLNFKVILNKQQQKKK